MIFETVDALARDQNSVQPGTPLVVAGDWIFCGYMTADLDYVVARRPLAGGPWERVIVGTGLLDDAHYSGSVGVDPAGHVHVAYGVHGLPLRYAVSTTPFGLDFQPATVEGVPIGQVSYPRFYRAGAEFFFIFRDGNSAAADLYMLRWTSAGWVGSLMISGRASASCPYLGQCIGASDGSLWVIWTHRVGLVNVGLHVARVGPQDELWRRVDGTIAAYPLSIGEPDILDSDQTVTNTGMSIAVDDASGVNIAYARHSARGHREVWHGRYEGGSWRLRQVTLTDAPRLRACPYGPQDGVPRPCDFELDGPTMILEHNGAVSLYWSRSVAKSRGAWARPAAIAYCSSSGDYGRTWSTQEIRRPVEAYGGELPRESSGLPLIYWQRTGSGAVGALELATCPPVPPAPLGSLSADFSGGAFAELSAAAIGETGFAVSAWMRPEDTGRSMAVLDKGGPDGHRVARVMLWATAGTKYSPGRMQVLLGNVFGGWGLIWYPEVAIPPGEISHVLITWDGTVVRLIFNGATSDAEVYAATSLQQGATRLLIGASRSAAGSPEHFYDGALSVQWWDRGLTDAEVAVVCGAPPRSW